MSDVPDAVVVNVHGRRIVATRERARQTRDEPLRLLTIYWVITVDGTRYVGWPADPEETEASILASLQQWTDKHPVTVKGHHG